MPRADVPLPPPRNGAGHQQGNQGFNKANCRGGGWRFTGSSCRHGGRSAGPASQRDQQQGLARGLLPAPLFGVLRLERDQLASALVRPRRLREPGAHFQGFRRFAKRFSRYRSAFMLMNVEVKLGARKHQPLMVDFRIDGLQSTDSKRIRCPLIPMVSFTWTLNPAIRSCERPKDLVYVHSA